MVRMSRTTILLPFLFLLFFLLGACSKSPDKQIIGTWNLDVESALAEIENEQEREMARAFMGAMSISMTFESNGTASMNMTMGGESESKAGTWTTISTGENTVKISMTTADEEPETQELDITIIDSSTIRITGGMGGQAMTFKRA